jgi:hypothetical protein
MGQFTHTIKITELKKQKQMDAFSDVVIHCRWQLKTTYSENPDIEKTFPGATPFHVKPEDFADGFTDFADLTEEQVISWIAPNAWNLPEIKARFEREILEEIEQPYEVINNPWNHDDVPTGPATPPTEESNP